MKKIIAVVLCGMLLLTGCANRNIEPVEIGNTTFDLISDRDTGIVYIKNCTSHGYYVYTPYYSENGKLCRYYEGMIVEVEDGSY